MSMIAAAAPLTKHVNDDCAFVFPFGAWLCAGDSLATVDSISEPSGELTIGPGVVANDTQAQANISGGVAGKDYTITAGITTESGCKLYRVFMLKVRDD